MIAQRCSNLRKEVLNELISIIGFNGEKELYIFKEEDEDDFYELPGNVYFNKHMIGEWNYIYKISTKGGVLTFEATPADKSDNNIFHEDDMYLETLIQIYNIIKS